MIGMRQVPDTFKLLSKHTLSEILNKVGKNFMFSPITEVYKDTNSCAFCASII